MRLSWEEALDRAASAIRDTIERHGNEGIFGGSYGWASAERFHHAQSQIHRFLNLVGGYTASVNTYSGAAGEVIVPHVLGSDLYSAIEELTTYEDIAQHSDLMLAFGGVCPHNNQVVAGGIAVHGDRAALRKLADAGVDIINVGPLADDVPAYVPSTWVQARPNTDTAIMLSLAHHLETTGRVDRSFLDRYTVGYEVLRRYLIGQVDGVPKNLEWAASISGVSEERLRNLAERLAASRRPMITIPLSLERTEHGEQPYWMAIALASMLGAIGLPGGGVGLGWGSSGRGVRDRLRVPFSWGRLDQGTNPLDSYIPVARIADLLQYRGETYAYDGQTRTYPTIDLIYWAGGNPFHHHQDLNRLRLADRRPSSSTSRCGPPRHATRISSCQ